MVSSAPAPVKEPILTYPDEPSPTEDGLSPVEEEPLIDVDMTNRSLLTLKRTRRSPSDAIISLREVSDITSESELEDTHLAKRQRLSEEQAESIVPYHVSPKPTLLPTPSSPSSSSRSSNDGQDGGTRSPDPSSNNPDEEGDDDGAHAKGVVEKGNRKDSDDQAEEIHNYFGRVKMSGKSRARCFQRSKRINYPERGRRPTTQSQSTMPTRKLRNVTSAQLSQLPRPRSDNTSRPCSPQTASLRMKARGRTTTVRPSANMAYQITDLTHCHVPEGSSILTAVVRSELNLSLNPIVLDHELLGVEGKIIRMTQLSPDSWMLLGYRHDGRSSTSTRKSPTLDTTDWMNSPRSDTDSHDADHSSDEDEEYKEDVGNPKVCAAKSDIRRQRTRELWLESDERRLFSYKDKMGMEWKDICERFPDRSPGAVKLRYYMLRKKES